MYATVSFLDAYATIHGVYNYFQELYLPKA